MCLNYILSDHLFDNYGKRHYVTIKVEVEGGGNLEFVTSYIQFNFQTVIFYSVMKSKFLKSLYNL